VSASAQEQRHDHDPIRTSTGKRAASSRQVGGHELQEGACHRARMTFAYQPQEPVERLAPAAVASAMGE
jgi:hypothetical protein